MALESRQPARVLHVVRPAAGGMKAHVLALCSGMGERGFESEIACPGDSDLVHDALEAGIAVHPVPIVGPINPLRDPFAVLAVAEVIRERRPAIVHAHGSKAGLIARLAVRIAGNPRVIVTVHNHVLYGGISPLMRRVYLTMERRLSRRTARIIAVSSALARELLDVFQLDPAKVVMIHNGLDLTPFLAGGDRDGVRRRLGVPASAFLYGIAARFAPQKGLDAFVTSAIPILEADPAAWLVVAGDGPLLEPVRTIARKSRARDRMLFPGFETDVPGLLSALDVYVNSSVSEALGLGTIEAMAAGLPVVATRVGGTPEVVEDGVTGVLVTVGKPAALTDAMLSLGRDAARRRRMGAAGRERALAEFGLDGMLDRTAAVYREVLA
jgi:glycosyltransferase involved in cell wall biosynthesis